MLERGQTCETFGSVCVSAERHPSSEGVTFVVLMARRQDLVDVFVLTCVLFTDTLATTLLRESTEHGHQPRPGVPIPKTATGIATEAEASACVKVGETRSRAFLQTWDRSPPGCRSTAQIMTVGIGVVIVTNVSRISGHSTVNGSLHAKTATIDP